MPEHFTKSTVEATVWCAPCGKPTPHRIDDGRRGPCLVCLEKRGEVKAAPAPPAAEQGNLF
jgi:hypothetical protein